MQYKKELMRELCDAAILFHASQELPYKLLEALDKHLPHIGDVCCERGCIEYEEKDMSGDHNMYADWEPRHERRYSPDGSLLQHKIQRTPDGPWEDYVSEEPPPVKKAQPKAFPNVTSEKGMDLRDYFAAKAMQGMLSNPATLSSGTFHGDNIDVCYQIADEMMKAREGK